MNSPDAEGVFDPGLQPERTLLAWRRTCLSFGLGSVVAMRYMSEELGIWAVLLGLAGLVLAVTAYAMTSIGYSHEHRTLRNTGALRRSGIPMLLASLAPLVLGALGTVYVVHGLAD